jgi:hypothetical protein
MTRRSLVKAWVLSRHVRDALTILNPLSRKKVKR